MLENIVSIQVALNLYYLEVKSQRTVIHVSDSCSRLLLNHVRSFSEENSLPAASHVRDIIVLRCHSSSHWKMMMTLWAFSGRVSCGKKIKVYFRQTFLKIARATMKIFLTLPKQLRMKGIQAQMIAFAILKILRRYILCFCS